MTPERFALMQQLLNNAKFDWTYGDTEYLREPVDFMPRYPKEPRRGGSAADQKDRFHPA